MTFASHLYLKETIMIDLLAPPLSHIHNLGSQGGLVVINSASHLCYPGSTLPSDRMWAEFQSISI